MAAHTDAPMLATQCPEAADSDSDLPVPFEEAEDDDAIIAESSALGTEHTAATAQPWVCMDEDVPVAAPARSFSVSAASESSKGGSDPRKHNPQEEEKSPSAERAMVPTGAPEESEEEEPRGEDPEEEDSDVAVAMQEDIAPPPKRGRR